MSHQHTRVFNSCINKSRLECLKEESWIHATQTGLEVIYEWIKSQLVPRAQSSHISRVLHSSGQSRQIMSICLIVSRVSFARRRNFVTSSTLPCWLVMSHVSFKMSHVSLETSHVSSAWTTSFMRDSCPVCGRDVCLWGSHDSLRKDVTHEKRLTQKRHHCIFQGWDMSVFNERATSCMSSWMSSLIKDIVLNERATFCMS